MHATIDGKAVAQELTGTAMPLDPGEHKVVLEAAGLPRTEKTLVLHEGEKARREVVTFAAGQPGGSAGAETKNDSGRARRERWRGHREHGGARRSAAASSSGADAPHPGHTQRLIGVSVAGVGLVGIVVGSIFGIPSKSSFDKGWNECQMMTKCGGHADGQSDVQSGFDQATISNVGFIAGGVLVAGGAALFLTAPKAGDVAIAPSLGDRTAGLTMRGAW